MQSVLLLGGGYVLRELASRLAPDSFVITSRSKETCDYFRSLGWISHRCDPAKASSMEQLFSSYPELHTCIDSVPPSPGDSTLYARNLIQADSGLKRLVFLSSTGVYGFEDGREVTEESEAKPRSDSGKRRIETEAAYESSGLQVCAARISGIYGPGRGVGLRLRAGTYRLIEGERSYSNRIHVHDIASVLEKLLQTPDWPTYLNLADDLPSLTVDVAEFYCDKFGFDAPKLISRAEAEASGRLRMLGSKRIKNHLMKQLLGAELAFPTYKEGAGQEFLDDPFANKE